MRRTTLKRGLKSMGRRRLKVRGLTLILLRIILALIVFLLILNSMGNIAFYLFILTVLADFLDGFLAKKDRVKGQLRSILDPFSDKLLVNLTAVGLYMMGGFPIWAAAAYLAKDLIVVSGGLYVLIKNAKTVFRSNVMDKVAIFIQLLTLFVALMAKPDYTLIWISIAFAAISFVSTIFRSGVRVVQYRTDLEEIRFRKLVKLPDLFTLLNIFMGLFAILLIIKREYFFSVIAMLFAVGFDYLDGKVARLISREGEFGKQLDSLADTISFGVAPTIFGFSLIQSNFAILIFALFLFSGVLRLARYNIMEFTGDFAGMPITVNGMVIPLIYFLHVPVVAYPYIYLFLAILMVSPLRVKKLF
jgi:CDP-diacylglycerol--serine O-phosphatidyltransferase